MFYTVMLCAIFVLAACAALLANRASRFACAARDCARVAESHAYGAKLEADRGRCAVESLRRELAEVTARLPKSRGKKAPKAAAADS